MRISWPMRYTNRNGENLRREIYVPPEKAGYSLKKQHVDMPFPERGETKVH
jgi:hypothetical protein